MKIVNTTLLTLTLTLLYRIGVFLMGIYCMVEQYIVTLQGCIILSPYSHFVKRSCKTYHCVTIPATFYSGYHYLHRLQQAKLATLSTAGTVICTAYNRYNYLHCLQQVQLSTLSTVGTTIYTVYSRYNYLHCLQ